MATNDTATKTRASGIVAPLLCAIVAFIVAMSGARAQEAPVAFEVETLNAGLGAPPERLDRSTPRSALEGFRRLTDRGDYASAAHLLDLDGIEPGEQREEGARLARRLAYVIERKVPLDYAAISDRPDGMDTTGSDREPMVGEPRKSLLLGTLEVDPFAVSIRLNRIAASGEAPVWVFAQQTVDHIDTLYAAFGPTEFEKWLPSGLRSEAFWGILWWELITVPLILAAVAAIAVFLFKLLSALAVRVPGEGLKAGIRRARLPVILLALGVFLETIVSALFVFSARTSLTISTLFWTLIVLALVYGVSRVLDTIIDVTSNRYLATIDDPGNTSARRWYTNLSAAKRIGVMLVIIIGLAAAFSSLNVFSSFGLSLLVSAGVATATFGLAAQAVLGNIFASLQLALAKPIRIGDAVYYDDHWAYVEQINYTYVQLRTWDQKRFIVPVKHFVSNPFENWTMADPQMILPVHLTLDHRTDVDALRRIFEDFAPRDPDWLAGAEAKVQVIGQDSEGIAVRFYCSAENPTAAWDLHCRVRERLLAEIAAMEQPSMLPRDRVALVENPPSRGGAGARRGGRPAHEARRGGEADGPDGEAVGSAEAAE